MVGSAIIRRLETLSQADIITENHYSLDLSNQLAVDDFFSSNNFTQVYLAAAKVGGIHANNTFPAEFIYQNLMIQSNVINAAFQNNIHKLLFLGSSCIYPRDTQQPIKEEALLSGSLEPTNEPYAIAKIAGIKLCESFNRQHGTDYRSVMPTNLYGPGDNFHPTDSHVVPGLIVRFHEAKVSNLNEVTVWGSGNVSREFLHVDDMASAAIKVMNFDKELYNSIVLPQQSHLNVGSGVEYTISELAMLIAKVINYEGDIIFDSSMPDGPKRKFIDSSLLQNLGWEASHDLENGLKDTYNWYLKKIAR
jgi:GDP-L-fucose synthase